LTTPHSSGVIPLDDAGSAALLRRVVDAARAGDAVVVFDLDSTLLDNRPRQARILREYGAAHGVAALSACRAEHWDGWDFRVAMRNAGLDGAALERHLAPFRAYWQERFFSSQYCVDEVPIAGAVEYLDAVATTGAQVAYVTGRHEAMRAGTVACLVRHSMLEPDGRRIHLVMKPSLDEHDDAYKARTYRTLDRLGRVVAAFDNEPTHINGYRTSFPDALSVHLATDHSLRGIPVLAGISSVRDFRAFGR
jgi:beta-phosphoglucomutase-like phosphatase (HAD superfamily)